MNVNFNNVRAQACFAYDRLCEKLNGKIDVNGDITIAAEDIQEDMDDLRMMIGTIAACSLKNDEEFKDVYEENYPADKSLICFNPE